MDRFDEIDEYYFYAMKEEVSEKVKDDLKFLLNEVLRYRGELQRIKWRLQNEPSIIAYEIAKEALKS